MRTPAPLPPKNAPSWECSPDGQASHRQTVQMRHDRVDNGHCKAGYLELYGYQGLPKGSVPLGYGGKVARISHQQLGYEVTQPSSQISSCLNVLGSDEWPTSTMMQLPTSRKEREKWGDPGPARSFCKEDSPRSLSEFRTVLYNGMRTESHRPAVSCWMFSPVSSPPRFRKHPRPGLPA